jgi:uncharacterized RDD family membrane protein YckC
MVLSHTVYPVRVLRLAGEIIDWLLLVQLGGLFLATNWSLPTAQDGPSATSVRDALGTVGTVSLLLFTLFLVLQWTMLAREGQTIGKKIMGIRVVDRFTGEPPGFLRAVVLRCWCNALLWLLPPYALFDALRIFRTDQRCLHDVLARTIVVPVGAWPTVAARRQPSEIVTIAEGMHSRSLGALARQSRRLTLAS